MTEVGNFEFESGDFDDWRYEVHFQENRACPQCDCYCTDRNGATLDVKCIPKRLYLTITADNCPGIEGTYEMNQCHVDEIPLLTPPVTQYWPLKLEWCSEVVLCPEAGIESHALAFILLCRTTSLTDRPQFLLTAVRFGGTAYLCSTLNFDPDDVDTVYNTTPDNDIPPSAGANAKATSTCIPFNLEFPWLTEKNFECSGVGACCGGTIVSEGGESDPSYFYLTITE
jgi:hypothetical protein